MVEGITALANSPASNFLRKVGGSIVNELISGTGDVIGPASAVDSNFASFNTTTGKLIKDSLKKAADFEAAGAIATHAALQNVHGLNITAGQTLTVTTGGTLGTAAYTASTAYAAALSGTINEIAYFNSATTIASLAVATYPSLTELSYVKGVTSAIQTQLGLLAPKASPTFTGTVIIPTPFTIGTVSMTATGTELNYVAGVTSAIQTQLNAKQASHANLTSLAALSYVSTSFVKMTAAGTFALDTATYLSSGGALGTPSSGTLTNCTGLPVAGLVALTASEIVITTAGGVLASAAVATYPSLTELTYVKGVTSAIQTQLNAKAATLSGTINEIAYFNSSTTIASLAVATYPSLTELTYVKGVTSAIQTQIGLKAPLASPTFTGTVTVPTPVNPTDAATKAYADAITQSLDIKQSARVASTADIAIATALINGSTIDGVVVATGDRVLLKNQTAGAENGIYVVVASGAASRSTDADVSADVTSGMYVFVSEGTVSADMGYVLTTNDPITLGTTALVFTQFSGAGQITAGAGLTKTGNTLDVIGTANRIVVAADAVDIGTDVVTLVGIQSLSNKTLVAPALGTPASGVMTNVTGVPLTGLVSDTTTALGIGSINLGHATDTTIARVSAGVISVEGVTIDTISGTNTLTNKRITLRVYSEASNATPTPNADSYDQHNITALAVAAAFAAPTGTPTSGQKLIIRILDNATARALSWNAIYRAGTDVALPTTTVLSKTLYCGFIYNTDAVKWDLVAVTNNI